MDKYKVVITQVSHEEIIVHANSEEEAKVKSWAQWPSKRKKYSCKAIKEG